MLQMPTEHSLWVVEYREASDADFGLTITLIEAKTSVDTVDTEVGPAHPVRPEADSAVFSVRWDDYVAMLVTNESFALPEPGSAVGYGLGTKVNSRFRQYIAATTFADDDYPGPLTHWYLNTEWHCFDILSATTPQVRRLPAEETEAILIRYLGSNSPSPSGSQVFVKTRS